MEAIKELLPLALHVSLLLLVFALGLDATPADAIYVFKRPRLLLRAIAAINVAVPLAAFLVASLPLTPIVKVAIVLMAVSPLPPVVPGKQLKMGERTDYVVGLYVAISILAILIVPLTVAIFSAAFPSDASMPAGAVARTVLISVLLPLAAGMGLRAAAPALAIRAAPVVSKLASAVLAVAAPPVLVAVAPAMWALVGNGTLLAIATVVGVGLIAGHVLGGPDAHARVALATASATRHPGIAMMIAKMNFAPPQAAPAVLLFLIVGLIAAIPYQVWARRHLALVGGPSAGRGW